MKHVNYKPLLVMVVLSALLLGSLVTPVSALQTNLLIQRENYVYPDGTNNHTYVYASPESLLLMPSRSTLHVNEDIDMTRYRFDATGWSSPDTSYTEPANVPFDWQPFLDWSNGPFGNPTLLPVFFDFVGNDGSGASINTTMERRVFTLGFGQHTPVVMDTDYEYYFGILPISGQEFVYLTIACQQDDVSWEVMIHDPIGRVMSYGSGSNGDIITMPFRPSIAGDYYILLSATPTSGNFAMFDLLPEAIAPQLISPNEIIQGNLPSGEIVVDNDYNSLVGDELRPTVHTYKIDPGTDVSRLTFAFNYPQALITYTQGATILFTSDAFVYGYMGGSRYMEGMFMPGNDEYYCRGMVNYITIMGGDNIDYTLYHESNVAEDLPVNHEFLIENYLTHRITKMYSLELDQDSIIKVNSTGAGGDFTTTAWAVNEDGYIHSQDLADSSTLPTSGAYYLPAGDYIFQVDVDSTTYAELEFTIGPLETSTQADIRYVGGFIVHTAPNHEYNLTLTLNDLYNISSNVIINIYDQFYSSIFSTSLTMGIWWDTVAQVPHSTDLSEVTYTIDDRVFSDEYAIIKIQVVPYNNTAGVGEDYEDYSMDFSIDWVDVSYDDYDELAFLDISTAADEYNFTLPFPGTSTEYYALRMNTTEGTWYNVSIMTGDVTSFTDITLITPYDHRTHYVGDTDLDDAEAGTIANYTFQFGAIGDLVYLDFRLSRSLSQEGFFWIKITPLVTHELELLPEPEVGADLLALLGGIAIPVGIGAVLVVVVVIVYMKKIKK